jgi:hypothetical protein
MAALGTNRCLESASRFVAALRPLTASGPLGKDIEGVLAPTAENREPHLTSPSLLEPESANLPRARAPNTQDWRWNEVRDRETLRRI